MKRYRVINECILDGRRTFPSATPVTPTPAEAERLVKAQCLVELGDAAPEKPGAPEPNPQPASKTPGEGEGTEATPGPASEQQPPRGRRQRRKTPKTPRE